MKKLKVKMNKPVYLGLSILEISKTLMYEFWYNCIKLKYQNNGIIWILKDLLFILKMKIFIKIMQMMLKKDMIHQTMMVIDHYQKEWISIGLMKHELRGKITTEFLALRPKTYSTEQMMLKMVKRLKE